MSNNQRVGIFLVIGVFVVSVLGSAIFLLADQNGSNQSDVANEVSEQADQIAQEEAIRQQLEEQAASCGPLPAPASPGAREVPEHVLPTGDVTELGSVDLTVGTGKEAKSGDCVVAYYHGTLTDGTVFDSAFERGAPNRFSLSRVIEGWQVGVPGMKEGGVRVLTIPSEQAYGSNGSPPVIGADADLVFVVELVEVVEI